MSKAALSRDYYKLLVDISRELFTLNDRLSNDASLIENYKIGLPEMDAGGIINYCILYDLGQAVKRMTGDIIMNSVEAAALILVSNSIVRGANSDLLANGYENVNSEYEEGLYQNLAQSYLHIVNGVNPFRLKAGDIGDNTRPADEVVPTWFSMPPALKQMNHILYDEYASMLYRFANIIARADGYISEEKAENLKRIHRDIYDPYGAAHLR